MPRAIQPRNAQPTRRLAADADGIGEAARLLASGELVALPTETVYGLGADASNASAVAAIYAAKDRPRFNPLIAHVADAAAAKREGVFDEAAVRLGEAFWPGPLTLVVPAAERGRVSPLARAGLSSVALRVPAHPIARALLEECGRPIAAPSANASGRISPTNAGHVLDDLDGRIAAVLDGGPCRIGIESTVIACLDGRPRLLRPGGLPRAEVEKALGFALRVGGGENERAAGPGMLASHYAPRARVRLAAESVEPGDAVLLFGDAAPAGIERAAAIANLSARGDLIEAAARLFDELRRLDRCGSGCIAVTAIPNDGLGEAINDRLARAAAPR